MSDDDVLLRRIEALSAELAKTKVERDHFYTQFQSAWAALTPRSEEEKRGLERVLAILKAKLSDGGGIVGPSDVQRAHNDFYRGRRLAFEECSTMLRAALTPSLAASEPVTLTYTNWRGETSKRTIKPKYIWFGATEWHPEPQWLLTAFDLEKDAERDFALKDFGSPAPAATGNATE